MTKKSSLNKDEKTGEMISYYHLFEYNGEGNIKKLKFYYNGKPDLESEYEYVYGDNNNWIQCKITSKEMTGKKEKIYEKFTRTYEYY